MALSLYSTALGVGALAVAGALAWNFTPFVGPHSVIKGLRADLVESRQETKDWTTRAGEWEASFREAEKLRAQERGEAVAAVDEEAKACDGRVAEARRSSSAIRAITRKEPTRDEADCPVRELVPAGSLRDALQPAAR